MARHKVEISGVNTANIKVLTTEEMNELFKRVKNGDTKAREELVNGNLKLVLSILKKFSKHVDNMDDLFQIGCIGLLKAIDNFDLSYGVKFSTYCVPMIQGEVKRYLRDNNSIRVSRSVKDLAYKALKLKEELTMEDNSEPTTERLAELLEVEPYNIVNALESMRDPISIFEPIYNDGGDTIYLFDQIEDRKTDNSNIDTKMSVREAISNLSRREQLVLEERFVIGKTQMEISEELGISQAQVSRIEKGIIDSLRDKLR
ncbi:MAG: SigB/SigF/SigG family RNA polymerase sigma factor [Bacilli bacterium]|nr:SigB/SigF/SigG family RNA polymerase sigma factor [Clostridium sp.]MDY6015700.1 SigB/SigF/SigG family RNA polymerase sigma factor [Bacilli bacterium]